VDKWDHNQIGTLLQAWANQESNRRDGFTQDEEFNLMERARCNGYYDDWIYNAMNADAKRCADVASYLRQREERKYNWK